MATREEIEAARRRVEIAREQLADEQARAAEAARDIETDADLAAILEEEARLSGEIEAVRAEADRQEQVNRERRGEVETTSPPVDETPPAPDAAAVIANLAQPSFPGLGRTGDDVTGRE